MSTTIYTRIIDALNLILVYTFNIDENCFQRNPIIKNIFCFILCQFLVVKISLFSTSSCLLDLMDLPTPSQPSKHLHSTIQQFYLVEEPSSKLSFNSVSFQPFDWIIPALLWISDFVFLPICFVHLSDLFQTNYIVGTTSYLNQFFPLFWWINFSLFLDSSD